MSKSKVVAGQKRVVQMNLWEIMIFFIQLFKARHDETMLEIADGAGFRRKAAAEFVGVV